ncbi:hypothetical protein J2T17_007216 [Paenibacillus mucilaginosus]|uniref:hypothetical protein n=1 Tax=Paenibacillus mucilaginosus TaxID=61624 RepID=UPI003D1C8380
MTLSRRNVDGTDRPDALTVPWESQILLELRRSLSRAAAPEELARCVWLLARMACAKRRGEHAASLLQLRAEEVWSILREELRQEPQASLQLQSVEEAAEEGASGKAEAGMVPVEAVRGLRRLAVQFLRMILQGKRG